MIERAIETDIPEITVLIEEAIKTCIDVTNHEANELVSQCVSNMHWWRNNANDTVHLVYRTDDRIVGVVLIKEYWNLVSLFVAPDHHARGIGKQLVLEALSQCRGKSPKGIVKLCSSTHAQDFYRTIGFHQVGEPKALPGGCIPFSYLLG
ncbi:GNAT family N-acetyltransferase [Photobacterium sp. SDRW27]|uniref:GNAT family N-acetyltransferase n=1 Tax=Photobacterium obscurum TaxID=2829490 RepID=UPI0022443441|nr:GNAT family N-acetyltransferase [Photobacterium obscurum]MCW8329908.1 GNAT family N-acetyltransferase [Photobacterium obscurum]